MSNDNELKSIIESTKIWNEVCDPKESWTYAGNPRFNLLLLIATLNVIINIIWMIL